MCSTVKGVNKILFENLYLINSQFNVLCSILERYVIFYVLLSTGVLETIL